MILQGCQWDAAPVPRVSYSFPSAPSRALPPERSLPGCLKGSVRNPERYET